MWLCFCCVYMFMLLSNTTLALNQNVGDTRKTIDNTVFSEVIRNISRVNNVLQELIENYEQVQNMYKSGSFEVSDVSTDSEIDEVFKEAAKVYGKKRKEKEKISKEILRTRSNFPATQMMMYEEDENSATDKSPDSMEPPENNIGLLSQVPKSALSSNEKYHQDQTQTEAKTDQTGLTSKRDFKNMKNKTLQITDFKTGRIINIADLDDPNKEETEIYDMIASSNELENRNIERKKVSDERKVSVEQDVRPVTKMGFYNDKTDASTETDNDQAGDIENVGHNESGELNQSNQSRRDYKEQDVDIIMEAIKEDSQTGLGKSFKNISKPKKPSHKDHLHSDEIKVPSYVFLDNVLEAFKNLSKEIKNENKKSHRENVIFVDKEIESNDSQITDKLPTTKSKVNRNVQQIIHSEVFNGEQIWRDIARDKPLNLKSLSRPENVTGDNNGNKYSYSNSTELLTNLERIIEGSEEKRAISDSSNSLSKEIEEINNLFKTQTLREGYADACLKAVVKKCYTACKKVNKVVCSYRKCRSSLKEAFVNNSKTGCIRAFRPPPTQNATRDNEIKIKPFIADDKHDPQDKTRRGLEACYPFIPQITNMTFIQNGAQRNILRDRYERECQKASAERCDKACTFAYTFACKDHECSKKLLKEYRISCKRQCKAAYVKKKVKEIKSTSLESSVSSDSDIDSDSDADTDLSLWK